MIPDLKHMRVLAGIEESRQSWSLPDNAKDIVAEGDDDAAEKDDDKKDLKPWMAKKNDDAADKKDDDSDDKKDAADDKKDDDADTANAKEADEQVEGIDSNIDIENYKRLIGDAGEGYRDWSLPVIK